jgi:ribonuclease P protein component
MAVPTRPHSLPRGRRLQRPGEFSRIRAQGRRVVQGCLILNWALATGAESRLGVVTSRKLGPAVERNRARRLMRECFRRNRVLLNQPVELVLVARKSINGRKRGEVEADFLTGLRRAGLLEGSPS